ncbi:hypothetical protein AB4Z01_10860 [Inquilinus sp. YAF38]|uniref:hypothetical protein n=1 Tax=Inquilinus sp. YAF38 TaxID=3233084 RepID=UPI003F91C418
MDTSDRAKRLQQTFASTATDQADAGDGLAILKSFAVQQFRELLNISRDDVTSICTQFANDHSIPAFRMHLDNETTTTKYKIQDILTILSDEAERFRQNQDSSTQSLIMGYMNTAEGVAVNMNSEIQTYLSNLAQQPNSTDFSASIQQFYSKLTADITSALS